MTTTTAPLSVPDSPSAPTRPSRATARRTAAYAAYLFLAWPVHLLLFITVVVMTTTGASLAFLGGIGLLGLIGAILIARLGAAAQRQVGTSLTGREAPRLIYSQPNPGDSTLRRLLTPLRDPQSWRDVAWAIVSFPISLFTWAITVVWCALIAVAPVSPILEYIEYRVEERWPGEHDIELGPSVLGELLDLPHPHIADVVITIIVGAICLRSAPAVLGGLARMQLGHADHMLSHYAREHEHVLRLRESRQAAHSAEAASLRRLERDLHDGPQQRLVRLNMDLARAKRHAGSDPARAQELLDAAMAQAQDTLLELRQLSRGIAPPILVDRGLEAAIMEAATRSTVPVTVRADLPALPMTAATAAYYVVAESLANINKHSGASQAAVTAEADGGLLRVIITDDGVGGASTAKGHGLAGLEQRLAGVDGTLGISSPTGGPTMIEAVIPCES